jgi:hypothetical protein
MGTKKGKTGGTVKAYPIIYKPGIRCMTLSTILPHRSFMNISMTIYAFCSGICKDKAGMTGTAGHSCVHTPERKPGSIMIIRIYLLVQLPPFGTVTHRTAYPEVFPMR